MMELNSFVTVADATKVQHVYEELRRVFQQPDRARQHHHPLRAQNMSEEKMAATVAELRAHNGDAIIITTPWDQITGKQILEAMETHKHDVVTQLMAEEWNDDEECDDPDCCCHDHTHHHHHDHEHEHHHHDHEHTHHHEHHHEHHHHADEVFTSWGAETPRKFTDEEIDAALTALDGGSYGAILRAKGIVPAVDGGWIHFDYVPFEHNVRRGSAEVTGRLCVIGAELKEDEVSALFHI